MTLAPAYPSSRRERDRFVLDRRGPRPTHDAWRPQGTLVEDERAADGSIVRVGTLFLTGRECPWRCVMCDLWQHTIPGDTPAGALVRQLELGLQALEADGHLPQHAKLYNASNFFDPRAVPDADYDAIAARLAPFHHVIVESHPALVGDRVSRFNGALARTARGVRPPSLEVAMGLETANPDALARLNKGLTRREFARAAGRLRSEGIALRVFLLVGVPFIGRGEQQDWIARSVAFAFDCGASVVSLIPTRSGNGALEALAGDGAFEPPGLEDLEAAFERALSNAPGRVFADVWDLQRIASCQACFDGRRERLRQMNLQQRVLPPAACPHCRTMPGRPA